MQKHIIDMYEQFKLIRAMALRADQAMAAYLAEMGMVECQEQLAKLQSASRRSL
jgi:hypothetical protein